MKGGRGLRGLPLVERLEVRTKKGPSCWLWTGCVVSGYGQLRDDAPSRKSIFAHRAAYQLAHGPIPAGMVVDHMCHNKLCVNPSHLRTLTYKQNGEHRKGVTKANTSGFLGVTRRGPNRWQGQVKHSGRGYSAGYFDTPEEAAEAARALRLSLFTHNDLDRKAA